MLTIKLHRYSRLILIGLPILLGSITMHHVVGLEILFPDLQIQITNTFHTDIFEENNSEDHILTYFTAANRTLYVNSDSNYLSSSLRIIGRPVPTPPPDTV